MEMSSLVIPWSGTRLQIYDVKNLKKTLTFYLKVRNEPFYVLIIYWFKLLSLLDKNVPFKKNIYDDVICAWSI